MRIVQINGGAKGSTGKIMMGIAEVARTQGHEVLCASPITSTNRDAGVDCGYYRIGTYNSRRMNVALARITGYNGCFAWIETHKLLKKLINSIQISFTYIIYTTPISICQCCFPTSKSMTFQ